MFDIFPVSILDNATSSIVFVYNSRTLDPLIAVFYSSVKSNKLPHIDHVF